MPYYQYIYGGTGDLTYSFLAWPREQPYISEQGVVNNASWQELNGAKPALSPGSYLSIFGEGLSDYEVGFGDYLPRDYFYLPLSLAGVSVSFDSGDVSVPGRLTYVSAYQVDVQVPWELAGKTTADLKVTVGGSRSNVYTIKLADAAPGVYESDWTNSYAAAQHANYDPVTEANPAHRGEWIIVYCNGLGPVTNAPASGDAALLSPLSRITKSISITVGGKTVSEIDFAGLSPESVGLYQVNLKVPADTPVGLQDIVITVNGNTSKAAKITVQ